MSYAALVTDYDGTIARDGQLEETALTVLTLLREVGWRLVLATGRELEHLGRLIPDLALFDSVVAENGAVLHTPATGHVRLLACPPPPSFAARLAAQGVDPLHQGQVISRLAGARGEGSYRHRGTRPRPGSGGEQTGADDLANHRSAP